MPKRTKEVFRDENGKVLDLSGSALRKADALERKKLGKTKKKKKK